MNFPQFKALANKAVQLSASSAKTTTGSGTGADVSVTNGEAVAIIDVTAVSGTSPTMVVTFEESDTQGGTYTQITTPTTPATATLTAAGAPYTVLVGIPMYGRKKWIRETHTIGGTTPSFTFTAHLLVPKVGGL